MATITYFPAASGGGAPSTATYITQTTDATLSAEQALASLASGPMFVTTATGVITAITTLTGLTSTSSTLTNDLITGKSGGQTIIGGTASGNNLLIKSNTSLDGKTFFGASAGPTARMYYDDSQSALRLVGASAGVSSAGHMALNGVQDDGEILYIGNAGAGTSAYAGIVIGNNEQLGSGVFAGIFTYGTAYATSGLYAPGVVEISAKTTTNLIIGNSSTGPIVFFTTSSRTERMRITTAGVLQVQAPMMTANATTACAITAVGPAGAQTTVQEWFTVTNAAGTVRYIPAF